MKRIQTLMSTPFFTECMDKNLVIKNIDRDCRHDLQHMIDVARITYILVLESGEFKRFIAENNLDNYQTAKEVIYASGLLHDIAKWQEYQTNKDHAIVGAEYAEIILEQSGFIDNEISVVSRAISEHRAIEEESSFLGEKLYRADNLARNCGQCPAWHRCPKAGDTDVSKFIMIY